MPALSSQLLPAVVGIGVLVAAAVWQASSHRVPNALTIDALLGGWMFAIHLDMTRHAVWPGHTIQASVLGSFAALAIMLPFYREGRLGAGCIKAQMAFAAWIGCAMPRMPCLVLTVGTTMTGLAFTFLMARMIAAEAAGEGRPIYEFPAQTTMTFVGVVGTIACWMILHPA